MAEEANLRDSVNNSLIDSLSSTLIDSLNTEQQLNTEREHYAADL